MSKAAQYSVYDCNHDNKYYLFFHSSLLQRNIFFGRVDTSLMDTFAIHILFNFSFICLK
jgi:hypothetical protein